MIWLSVISLVVMVVECCGSCIDSEDHEEWSLAGIIELLLFWWPISVMVLQRVKLSFSWTTFDDCSHNWLYLHRGLTYKYNKKWLVLASVYSSAYFIYFSLKLNHKYVINADRERGGSVFPSILIMVKVVSCVYNLKWTPACLSHTLHVRSVRYAPSICEVLSYLQDVSKC